MLPYSGVEKFHFATGSEYESVAVACCTCPCGHCGTGESASPLMGIAWALQVPETVTFHDPDQWLPEAQKRHVEWNNRACRK